ncbi:MAG: hypothetical protein JWM90_17 [Thermoleophilia bacterium]|nr:hypothetical protein [Thermoleophilia bacterium]
MNVDQFLTQLEHTRIDEVRVIRAAILGAHEDITEQVKWNAPSFCWNGDDRVTFRLKPGDRVELIFHRGAKVRDDVEAFTFDDQTGMIAWKTQDRGVVSFVAAADTEARLPQLPSLVLRWMEATAGPGAD